MFVQHFAHSYAGLCWDTWAHSSNNDKLHWQKVKGELGKVWNKNELVSIGEGVVGSPVVL